MAAFLGFVLLATIIAIPVGVVWPRTILWKAAAPTRGKALAVSIAAMFAASFAWVSAVSEPSETTVEQPQVPVAKVVQEQPVQAALPVAEPLPPGMKEKIISLSNAGLVSAVRNEAPRLSKVAEEKRGPVMVETYVSEPSKVHLTLETLPGHGLLPQNPAVLKASMTRPLADKPSQLDGGLAKTIDAFVFFSAPDWHEAEQKAFVGECLMTLISSGCDSTIRGVRVVAKRYGTDAFKIETFRP